MQKNNVDRYSLLVLALILNIVSLGQSLTFSPYSRYGLGELNSNNFAQNLAMGGLNQGLRNDSVSPYTINISNPASYTSIHLTTFELGANFNNVSITSATQNTQFTSGSLGYAALAFPITKWWGGAFGLVPYSSVGYYLTNTQNVDSIGNVTSEYEGSGGLNRVFIGNSIKPIKQLSIGFNSSFMFGNLINDRRVLYPSSSGYFNTKVNRTTHISDFYFDYGAQYEIRIDSSKNKELKEPIRICFGATFGFASKLNASTNTFAANYTKGSFDSDFIRDTILYKTDESGSIQIPAFFGGGVTFKKGNSLVVGIDYVSQNWSNFMLFGRSGELKNNDRISLGIQFVPNKKAEGIFAYWKQINYRAGLRYTNTYLELKNTQLSEMAASIGLGLPVHKMRQGPFQNIGYLNISVEAGVRGTTNNGLLKESFIRGIIGITINDRWFIKPKFD